MFLRHKLCMVSLFMYSKLFMNFQCAPGPDACQLRLLQQGHQEYLRGCSHYSYKVDKTFQHILYTCI